MSQEKKDSGFSFDNTPSKIGGDSKGEDFTFTDIPVLGKQELEKKKGVFSFDRSKQEKPKEEHRASYESAQKEQGGQPQGAGAEPEPSYSQDQAQPQGKWDSIAIKKKFSFKFKLNFKMLIIAGAVLAAVVSAGAVAFVLMKPKPAASAAGAVKPAPGAKPGKADPKAEEEAKRIAALEKKLAEAAAALKDSKFKDALKLYQSLLTESWKDKELVLLYGEAECCEGLKQDDDALKGYQKCIDGGWKENPQPFLKASRILAAKGNKDESVKFLEKARVLFPSDLALGNQLALAYNAAGQFDKAAAEFKKISKTDLSLDNLKLYCSILLKKQDKEQARELYAYASKKFRDLDCFMSAAALMDKPQERIDLMNQALTVIDEKVKSIAIMYLAELLTQTGKKDDASKQLDKINLGDLKPDQIQSFLKMLVNCGNQVKFKTEYKKAIDLFPKDFFLHREMFETMMDNGQAKLALDTFSEWWISKSSDYVAGYFYAKSLGTMPDEAVSILKKVVDLNPAFFEAFYDLAYFYTLKRDFQGAETAYGECARLKPGDKDVQQQLAFARLRNGKGDEAIASYEKFLEGQDFSAEDRAVELLNLSFRLPAPEKAAKYIEVLKENPRCADELKAQTMRYKLIYGKPTDDDFAEPYPKSGRKYHEFYLLSKGRTNEVLRMTVPPDEFPDFWKLFILWRGDKPGWQEGMDALAAKNKDRKDAMYAILPQLWNGKLSADDARKNFDKIHPDDEAFFNLMLAERYRKDRSAVKAKVSYQKAASEKQNPISGIADFLSKQPIPLKVEGKKEDAK